MRELEASQAEATRLRNWLTFAPPGMSCVYYVGNMGMDRIVARAMPTGEVVYTPNLIAMCPAAIAWDAYEQGLVSLTQHRTDTISCVGVDGDGNAQPIYAFEYIMQRTEVGHARPAHG